MPPTAVLIGTANTVANMGHIMVLAHPLSPNTIKGTEALAILRCVCCKGRHFTEIAYRKGSVYPGTNQPSKHCKGPQITWNIMSSARASVTYWASLCRWLFVSRDPGPGFSVPIPQPYERGNPSCFEAPTTFESIAPGRPLRSEIFDFIKVHKPVLQDVEKHEPLFSCLLTYTLRVIGVCTHKEHS